jgi:predicted RNA-binding Zn ribbon-like protein
MGTAGVLPAVRVDTRGVVEPFVSLPTEQARVAWALWWCFQDDELKRLRRCDAEGCGRWFRDTTKPLNQRRCSQRCTKRLGMRAYRAALRRKKRSKKTKRGGR